MGGAYCRPNAMRTWTSETRQAEVVTLGWVGCSDPVAPQGEHPPRASSWGREMDAVGRSRKDVGSSVAEGRPAMAPPLTSKLVPSRRAAGAGTIGVAGGEGI